MTCCLLLLVTMFACSSAFNWQPVQNLNQGKTGHYSIGCTLDFNQVSPIIGQTFAQEPVECMNDCIASGGDAFDVTTSGCSCVKRDMTKAPQPFIDNASSSPSSKQVCGCIDSAK
jgi:hypothetical protein